MIFETHNNIIQSLKSTYQILDLYIRGFPKYSGDNELQRLG